MKLVGVLNCTPDSFSDGGMYQDCEAACAHAQQLVRDGAAIIDIGGDSTRPGSTCIGAAEEWSRIGAVVREVSSYCKVSVDTHFVKTASQAIEEGASVVNNVFATSDDNMCRLLLGTNVELVFMYSRCAAPHEFSEEPRGDIVEVITSSLERRIENALTLGLSESQIVLDPGMGAFISSDPNCSWELLCRFGELKKIGFPLMLACSRKGFLKRVNEDSIAERDLLSAYVARSVASSVGRDGVDFVRVHDVALHARMLRAWLEGTGSAGAGGAVDL